MNVKVQIDARDNAKAWGLLVRQFAGAALPERVFIVSEQTVEALREAGVRFTELSRDAKSFEPEEVNVSEGI